jgi:predicted membrane channel-forming protein YqfA (hemolysin III family)
VLVLIWAGAAGGIVLSLLWPDAPRISVSAAIYISLGWGRSSPLRRCSTAWAPWASR